MRTAVQASALTSHNSTSGPLTDKFQNFQHPTLGCLIGVWLRPASKRNGLGQTSINFSAMVEPDPLWEQNDPTRGSGTETATTIARRPDSELGCRPEVAVGC